MRGGAELGKSFVNSTAYTLDEWRPSHHSTANLGAAPHPAFGHLLRERGEGSAIANKAETMLHAAMNLAARDSTFQPAYLAKLNDRAAEGGRAWRGGIAGPLLIIAGAGSGKTNTLAHRVAHLIVKGADPRRILLMTFSRRAAAEMTRRVERIAGEVLGRRRRGHHRRAELGGHLPSASAPGCCATMRWRSGSIRPSRSTTARTPPT